MTVGNSGARGLPRLLAGAERGGRGPSLAAHERTYGPMPWLPRDRLIEEVGRSGLRGRGGADFPTARKLAAVAERRSVSAVVVNGSETEPASDKDTALLTSLPHLVLDGAVAAAEAIGAAEVIVKLGPRGKRAAEALRAAIEQRAEVLPISIVQGTAGYVTGEESAVINYLNGAQAKPTLVPPRPYERGFQGKPTLVQNPETLAQLALIARFGSGWYRELGTVTDPGTVLVTISGAVRAPGVYELEFGTPLQDLLDSAGGSTEPIQAVLIGGYFGTWATWEQATGLRLAREQLANAGHALGAGVIIALGESACGLHESAALARYLAGQSAGQCGPCVHGLAAMAESFSALVAGEAADGERGRLLRWAAELPGRGACHHPDGAARLIRSSVATFGPLLETHRRRVCRARPAGLPGLTMTPAASTAARR
jgi:NADH:ubiquinone oxidoreductase subunit F (NADH-binding)